MMPALGIRQPFVERILSGEKTIEYRSTPTRKRCTVYLYASKKVMPGYEKDAEGLPRGLILGTVDIVDCKKVAPSQYEWYLKNPRRYKRKLKPKNRPHPIFFNPF